MKFKTENGKSLFVTVGLTIFAIVAISVSLRTYYEFTKIKNELTEQIKYNSLTTSQELSKTLVSFIEAYSINEYEKIISNEMLSEDILAIVVDNYKMGEITGTPAYSSGSIKNKKYDVVEFNVKDDKHKKIIENAFYIENTEIINSQGEVLGQLSVYMTDYYIKKKTKKLIIENILTSLLLAIFLIGVLFIVLRLIVLKPIDKLISDFNTTDIDGIPLKIHFNGNVKEIDFLLVSINKMINAIKESRIELKKQKDELHYHANYDLLTELPNKFFLGNKVKEAIENAKENDTFLVLLFIDLDYFKKINDSLGHEIGDEVLKIVKSRLKDNISDENIIARISGDEFAILTENLVDLQLISNIAENLLKVLSESMNVKNNILYVSTSIGISVYPNDADTFNNLLKYADSAMHEVKKNGGNSYRFYSSKMTELALEKVNIETGLREAIKKKEFVVYYQPQINGRTNQVIGMEALVRWEHPTEGIIPPYKFIPLAESLGLIIELDKIVMQKAMRQVVEWYKKGLNPGVLSVNLSVKQLQHKDCIPTLVNIIRESNIDYANIELEVTESEIMTNPVEAIKNLQQINDLGISLAVDDFGTGYSSLAYLKRLPISKLKIDREFVKDLPNEEEDIGITKAIIALAKSLNLKVIAEGVETEEQKEFLVVNGCENIQGYFYAKPMPAKEMEIFLQINS